MFWIAMKSTHIMRGEHNLNTCDPSSRNMILGSTHLLFGGVMFGRRVRLTLLPSVSQMSIKWESVDVSQPL
jgi:hypothetical protein